MLLGQMSEAYAGVPYSGPVRLLFTDHRFVVLANGLGSVMGLPSPVAYRAWVRSLGPRVLPESRSEPISVDTTTSVFELPNAKVRSVWTRDFRGLFRGEDGCRLFVRAPAGDVRSRALGSLMGVAMQAAGAIPLIRRYPNDLLFFIPWSREIVREFIHRTPLAPVAHE
jgi:hypothetical protein